MKRKLNTGCIMILLAVLSMTAGCFSPEKYKTPLDARVTEISYGDIALAGDLRDRWWEAYGNEALNAYVKAVLENSPTIQSAWLKILDSDLALEQAQSGYFPTVSMNVGVGGGGNVYGEASADPNYSLGVSASYEIDLWGKVRAQKRVAELSAESARDSADSALISLAASAVSQWFTVQYYRDRKLLTEQLLLIAEDYYSLVEEYYRTGQATGMDVLEQSQQLETLRSTIKQYDTQIRIGLQSLSILSGNTVRPEAAGSLPEAIDVGGSGDADTILESRPDIRAARRSAEQADARVVIAIADMFPSLRIGASLSYRNKSIADLFKTLLWDVSASLAYTIFEGFSKSTQIDRAKIAYLTQRFSYAVTVMNAIAEIETAILNLKLREQLLQDAQDQLERQKKILEVSREFFIGGQMSYDRVLSALRSLISSSQSELDARRNLLTAQIDFFKAVGGGAEWIQSAKEHGQDQAKQLLKQLDDEDVTHDSQDTNSVTEGEQR